jgi:hypothetical protein
VVWFLRNSANFIYVLSAPAWGKFHAPSADQLKKMWKKEEFESKKRGFALVTFRVENIVFASYIVYIF